MIIDRKLLRNCLLLAAVAAIGTLRSFAGDIDLEWNPVDSSNLQGYRINYDVQPGHYRNAVDVGKVTTTTLHGLKDCTYHYVVVKAVDSDGLVSEAFSNVVEGFPHPQIDSVVPALVRPGESVEVVVSGNNIAPSASPGFSNPLVTVDSFSVDACGRMTLHVTVSPEAPSDGFADLLVTNSDRSFGMYPAALRFSGGVGPAFRVDLVSPTPGTGGVDPQTPVVVTFTRPVDPKTVTTSHFKIRKVGAKGDVHLARGYPQLDETGTRVTLQVDGALDAGQAYTAFVKGGAKGVMDANGVALPADYLDPTGFSTADIMTGLLYGPSGGPNPTDLQPLEAGTEVPTSSLFVARFSERLDPGSLEAGTFKIRYGKKKVVLKSGIIPSLSGDGKSAILEPAQPLPPGRSFQLQIRGGVKGVKSVRGVKLAKLKTKVQFTTPVVPVEGLGVAD